MTVKKTFRCAGCGEDVPEDEVAFDYAGHTVPEHANDYSCRDDRHSNCPVPVLCGPIPDLSDSTSSIRPGGVIADSTPAGDRVSPAGASARSSDGKEGK